MTLPGGVERPTSANDVEGGPADPTAPSSASDRIQLAPEVELERWFSQDLGNFAYAIYVGRGEQSVIIDPVRDVDTYLPALDAHRKRRMLALETHVHNDFVSGSRELVDQRGAELGASKESGLSYPHRPLGDGEDLPLGDHRLRVWSTPGHTPEHVSYLLVDPNDAPVALFSGGALMVGSAARTDLLGPSLARPLALKLYRTLHERIARLPASTLVFPTHGGGSFCGKGNPERRSTTIGEELRSNPLLLASTVQAFLDQILDQRPYPRYFDRMRSLNRSGAPLGGFRPSRVTALDLDAVDSARAAGAVLVDLRPFAEFDEGHIPDSYWFGLDGALSAWVGWLLPPDQSIIWVASGPRAPVDASRQLYRIGYDRVVGTLRGGFEAWRAAGRPTRSTSRIGSMELREKVLSESPSVVLDVRERHEFAAGHIPGAVSAPLSEWPGGTQGIPRDAPVVVHCAHGYRSGIALSLLEREGFPELIHADEGYDGWKSAKRGP
jgi:hydroxyacylglutathione hydrolase